ncbi:MAG: acylphosphatase, partial [Bacteroidota bacterium]
MSSKLVRAEIVINGLVQGVGYRYFVYSKADNLGLHGFVKNLFSGEVYTVVEGEKFLIEDFFENLKIGPRSAHVRNASINWTEPTNEFTRFEIRY